MNKHSTKLGAKGISGYETDLTSFHYGSVYPDLAEMIFVDFNLSLLPEELSDVELALFTK